MDEGRPIDVGGGGIMTMIRTPEGHLWATRSRDDGKTWSKPEPTPLVDERMMEVIERDILVPTVHAMKRARAPFAGVLYAGLMLTNQGPKVLEYNVRFGDPECQVLMMRLMSDLLPAMIASAEASLVFRARRSSPPSSIRVRSPMDASGATTRIFWRVDHGTRSVISFPRCEVGP